MRFITRCPACQTQFFVNKTQIDSHHGQVRCGYCLFIFDANEHIVKPEENDTSAITTIMSADDDLVNSTSSPFLSDLADKEEFGLLKTRKKFRLGANFFIVSALLLIAVVQSVYFLRNEIALHYPQAKPYLVRLCKKIACNIELPKQIELLILDDYAIQEDTRYLGLMRVSSTLINQAKFSQAYPNIELTLTNSEHQPVLRRIFKPNEYLAKDTNITNGLPPSEEVKINLAIGLQDTHVAGYRLLVTY